MLSSRRTIVDEQREHFKTRRCVCLHHRHQGGIASRLSIWCISTAGMSGFDGERTERARPQLIPEPRVILPPDNFGVVEPGLYRSSLPQAANFSHLRGLNLRSVVVLCDERPTRSAQNFFEAQSITIFHTGANSWIRDGSWKPISDEVVKDSLQILLRRDNLPALVCDVGGLHLVGMLVGCLRRLQHWNINSAVDEYRAYAASRTRYNNEQFIELYDIDLVTIPDNPPEWFAEQVRREKEERSEFRDLLERDMLDEEGTLRDKSGHESFKSYYYSTTSPLNTVHGGKVPRIQIL